MPSEPVAPRADAETAPSAVAAPTISLPKGGGAIRGIGETFSVSAATGTGSLAVPIYTSPGRAGFQPTLSLRYDSGSGNGPFGMGWSLDVPSVARKTDTGLPRYRDSIESDTFVLSSAEDLVPSGSAIQRDAFGRRWNVRRFRPRVEGLFARVEHWRATDGSESHWRVITRENVTNLYGLSSGARIADPADSSHIFQWLLERTYDDKGNVIAYIYKAEDGVGIDASVPHERHRLAGAGFAQRYLKGIRYGNRAPHQPGATPFEITFDDRPEQWLFEVVFDYGEHDPEAPDPREGPQVRSSRPWPVRTDAFSSYRAGFEVRTYRRCERVLMFHHVPDGRDHTGYDGLVRSTDLSYRDSPFGSFVEGITQSGYARHADGTYLKRSLPQLGFGYSEARIDARVHDLDTDGAQNLPRGVDGNTYQWLDLDAEGLTGVVTEQADGWFYKRNYSPTHKVADDGGVRTAARLGPVELVATKPALGLAQGQLMDLGGDGLVDLVDLSGPVPGFYERTDDGGWADFRSFASFPNLDPGDPSVRLVDLDGDGLADVLLSEDDGFRWHPSLGEDGFGDSEMVVWPPDEESGPRVLLADATGSIHLADMAGDGLADIARFRNGEICYWPNLGYGRFGSKVVMDSAPRFDHPDQFDPRRVRLGDIDGSGTTDVFYIGRDATSFWHNQSGNSWSAEQRLPAVPTSTDLTTVSVVDLLGNGTACLVWSSDHPTDSSTRLRYMDLMGGQKPHLLTRVDNNLGSETRIVYATSTKFYVSDRDAGRPWITTLPFPVHVVERSETHDQITGNRFVTTYEYHHGFFDGVEREFRGFGMVEQRDTEDLATFADGRDVYSHVPPTLTRTWFHTGAYLGRDRISRHYMGEYYREPGLADAGFDAQLLPDTILPPGLSAEEERQACRALRGSILRQEVYGLDDSPAAVHPYSTSERSYSVELVQSPGDNRHAVFLVHPREVLDRHYERDPVDPRVSHQLTLETDEFGNVLRSAAVAYGRLQPDPELSAQDQATQAETLLTCAENRFTNAIDTDSAYRAPLPAETRSFQLSGLTRTRGTNRFSFDEVLDATVGAGLIDYEQPVPPRGIHKRLLDVVRIRYRPDDLGAAVNDPSTLLGVGELQPLALAGEAYTLALTPGLLESVHRRARPGQPAVDLLPDPAAVLEGRTGGYVDLDSDGRWWVPSGRVFHSPGRTDLPAAELAHARAHFFLPQRYRDPFDTLAAPTESIVTYDAHDLLVAETRDALGNRVTVGERGGRPGHDYRVLQPRLVTDPEGMRSEVVFDALGMVVATAVMGAIGENLGDSIDDFTVADANPTSSDVAAFTADPAGTAAGLLYRATSRIVYDVDRYQRCSQPPFAATIARETHVSDLDEGAASRLRLSFVYGDGIGRELETKVQAEPGDAPQRGAAVASPNGCVQPGPLVRDGDGRVVVTPAERRWVGSGRTVYDNKGNPVRRYEPFFSSTHLYEPEPELTDTGVSSALFYDPAGRVVTTLHPNNTYEKVVFDPWRRTTWDVNDTVCLDPRTDPDVQGFTGGYFAALGAAARGWETWHAARVGGRLGSAEQAAAVKTAAHSDTPTIAYSDALGRPFVTVANNGVARRYPTRLTLDIEGNQREAADARGRVVMRFDHDMVGNLLHQASMEAGERWMLNDARGNPIRSWNSRGQHLRNEYDQLRRPVRRWVTGTDADASDPRTLGRDVLFERIEYQRTRVRRQSDGAGIITNERYDFKGNVLETTRQLTRDHAALPDWSATPAMQPDVHRSITAFDAVNRPVSMRSPDTSEVRPTYNEAGLLQSVEANLQGEEVAGEPVWRPFVTNVGYDSRGQRTLIVYGNHTETRYRYDPQTFRLVNLSTTRPTAPSGLQDLHYTYDPVGNITEIRDLAQQPIFFRNRLVEASNDYTYDPLYRLTIATGREHLGQDGAGNRLQPAAASYNDRPRVGHLHPSDGNAMGTYVEELTYDEVGNILALAHGGTDPRHPGWRRDYAYNEASLLGPGQSNRLSATTLHPAGAQPELEPYAHDAHGNMTTMSQLRVMRWDFKDQLVMTQRQAVNAADVEGQQRQGERTYYVYDAAGERVRRVTELPTGRIKDERVYLGGFEIYRRNGRNAVVRETLHIMDGQRRVAQVETRTDGDERGVPEQLIRYQLGNHLGSAVLELDDGADVISYEEYYPYGCTSYQASRNATEAPNRYRYTSKERDEESGLYYHGARYYAPWLGRWTAADPLGVVDGTNLYAYAGNNPALYIDPTGTQYVDPDSGIPLPGGVRDAPPDVDQAHGADAGYEPPAHPGTPSGDQQFDPGSSLLLGGLASTVGGVVTIASGGSALVLLGGAFALSSGIAATSVGVISATLDEPEFARNAETPLLLASSPATLTAGTVGLLAGGEKGLKAGIGTGVLLDLGAGVFSLTRHGGSVFETSRKPSTGFLHADADILGTFESLQHTTTSKAVFEGIEKGRFSVIFKELENGGYVDDFGQIFVDNTMHMHDILPTLVHEGRHALDILTEIAPPPSEASHALRLLTEIRAFEDAAEFAALNSLQHADALQFAGKRPDVIAISILNQYKAFANLGRKRKGDVFEEALNLHFELRRSGK